MSSNPLTSEDLLRYRRVLDEALAADRLDSAQYRTRIRALVLAASKRDLNALIEDLVPAVGEPGFSDEGHEVPMILSSTPAEPKPRPWEMFRTSQPSPIDSFPSFPGEEEELVPDGDTTPLDEVGLDEDTTFSEETGADEDTARLGETRLNEDGAHREKPRPQADEEPPEPVMTASPGFPEAVPEVDGPATHVVPVVPSATPAVPAETVPGELVPVRQWSAEVSSVEQAPTSTALAPVEHKPTAELSRLGQRSTEVSQVESRPEAALSPAETDDDGSVNRVVVVMVPSAPSPDEPNVITSSWDELPSADPKPTTSPMKPAEPTPAEETMAAPEPEEAETITRISAPMNFDDSEAPTQVLDAVKDLSIFRDEATEKISEPPQPVLPYSMNQGFSSTPADPMAQATTAPFTEYAVPPMPPPVPEPSAEALASMPPPVPPSANPPQDPWAPYGQMPPPDPAAMAPPPMSDSGYGAVPSAPYYGSPQPYGQYMPPPSAPYQPPAPVYSMEPAQDQAPKRRSTWAWVVVTMMVLALLVWVAYLVIFRQGRHAAPEISSQIQVSAAVATSASPVTGGQ